MAFPWGAIGSAVAGNVAGGLVNSLFGGDDDGGFSAGDTNKAHEIAYYWDRKNVKHRARWLVESANRAGVHPLMLFGGSGMSPSASPIAVNDPPSSNPMYGMGQDISRAMMAAMSSREREEEISKQTAYADASNALNLENMNLQNELLRSQIRTLPGQIPPGLPDVTTYPLVQDSVIGRTIPNTVSIENAYQVNPSQITSHNPKVPSLEAGPPTPGFKQTRIGGPNFGATMELPSQELSQQLESLGSPYSLGTHLLHNTLRAVDKLATGGSPPTQKLPSSHEWRWNPFSQRWQAVKKGRNWSTLKHRPFTKGD